MLYDNLQVGASNPIADMRELLDGPAGEEIPKSCRSAGFVGLAFCDSGARRSRR